MSDQRTIKFVGHITTVSPVSISTPDNDGMLRNTHGAYYISASSFRGMLRHTASKAIAELLHREGKTLTTDTHYMNFTGTDTGRKLKLGGGSERLASNIEIRKKNPQISSFGNFTIAGKIKIGNAYCDQNINPITIYGAGSRNHPFNRDSSLIGFIPESELLYLKEIIDADSKSALATAGLKSEKDKLIREAKQLTGDDKKEILKQVKDIEAEIKAVKSDRTGSENTITFPIAGFEAIDLGHKLSHRMILTNPSELDLQYFLWTLWRSSVDFHVGGHRNVGCGEIAADWDIIESSFDDPTPRKIGRLVINQDGFQLEQIAFNPKEIDNAISSGEFNFDVF